MLDLAESLQSIAEMTRDENGPSDMNPELPVIEAAFKLPQ
jgi:hypothetical protein